MTGRVLRGVAAGWSVFAAALLLGSPLPAAEFTVAPAKVRLQGNFAQTQLLVTAEIGRAHV